MNKQPISRETGGLSDSKRLTTNDDDEQTTVAKDNDYDEFELQGSSSFCVTIRFSTKPMTNNNNNSTLVLTKSLLKRQFQL
jgi:hypothetical protein